MKNNSKQRDAEKTIAILNDATMANLKKRGKKWSVQWGWNGRQKIKALGLEDERAAKARLGLQPARCKGVVQAKTEMGSPRRLKFAARG